jgi:hypothetical protein
MNLSSGCHFSLWNRSFLKHFACRRQLIADIQFACLMLIRFGTMVNGVAFDPRKPPLYGMTLKLGHAAPVVYYRVTGECIRESNSFAGIDALIFVVFCRRRPIAGPRHDTSTMTIA